MLRIDQCERDRMPAIVAHDALGDAGRARGVEDVERVGRQHRHAIGRAGPPLPARANRGRGRRPARPGTSAAAGSTQASGFDARLGDRRVEQRLVGDDPVDLDAARGREDDLRLGVVDAGRQLVRGEPAEHDRMDRADAGAGEHRDRRLGHHRHVDQHAVALDDAEPRQHAGEPRDLGRAARDR